jgi:hypothetical protein
MCTGTQDIGHLLKCDSTDREEWKGALRYRLTQTSEPSRLPILGFARCGINRPKNEEISPGSRSDFFRVVSRYANQFPRTQEPTSNGDRKGSLPKVYTVSFYGQGDVHSIVDQQTRLITGS